MQTNQFACIWSALTLPTIACVMDQPAGPTPIPFADNRPPPCCHSDGEADRRLATGGLRRGDLARCSRARLAAARAQFPKRFAPATCRMRLAGGTNVFVTRLQEAGVALIASAPRICQICIDGAPRGVLPEAQLSQRRS